MFSPPFLHNSLKQIARWILHFQIHTKSGGKGYWVSGLLIFDIADDDFIAKKTSQSAPLSNSEGTQTSKAFDKTVVHNLT